MNFLRALHLILTLRCEQSARLRSDQLERRLSFSERLALRVHIWICGYCRRFERQIEFLSQASRQMGQSFSEGSVSESAKLSPEARQRILDSLREERN